MLYNIIGWYGTETMGDIAILDGIINVIRTIDDNSSFVIGSLYPFYTERTIYSNKEIFFDYGKGDISTYSVKNKTERTEMIKRSDAIIIGGGPLMSISEIIILRDVFFEAKKYGIPRIIFGCGIGPIFVPEYAHYIKETIELATAVSFRDNVAKLICKDNNIASDNFLYLGDPAVISIERYKSEKHTKKDTIAFNLRKFPLSEYGEQWGVSQKQIKDLLEALARKYEILLVPMHTFFIGGDDREYFSELMAGKNIENIKIQFNPQNLQKLYDTYCSSFACIGMRYHAVVMQTLLNGNNIVFNYTGKKGKIQGFLEKIDKGSFYKNRCINLVEETISNEKLYSTVSIIDRDEHFSRERSIMKEQYVDFMRKAMM